SDHGVQERNCRVSIVNFPEQVWQENQKRNGRGSPDFPSNELLSCRSEKKPNHNSRAKKEHGMLVKDADSGDESEQEPQTRATAIQDPQDDGTARHPDTRPHA